MNEKIYRLADGRLWDVRKAAWIDPVMTTDEHGQETSRGEVTDLVSADGKSDVDYLAKTLAFYDLPLGELAMYSEKGIKEELARLDAEYLTPRTLAGLSQNDQEALERYAEHEKKAAPLRERLRELEQI